MTKQNLINSVSTEVADVLLARMEAGLILGCFNDVLATVPAPIRARASNGLIKAYVRALFDKTTFPYSRVEQTRLLQKIFICRGMHQL